MKKIIVGLNEDKNLGLSIFDLSGNLIDSSSIRAYDKESLISYIEKFGMPISISLINDEIPRIAEYLARKFDVPIVYPDEIISSREITINTRKYNYKTEEEKQAIYAGLYVFKKFKKEFKEVENILKNMGQESHIDYAKELLVRGDVESVFQAVEKSIKLPAENKRREERKRREECEERYKKLSIYVKELEKKLEEYEKIEKEVSVYNISGQAIEELKKAKRRILELEEKLQHEEYLRDLLEEKLNILQEERLIEKHNLIPAPRIKEFTIDEISEVRKKINLSGKVVVVDEQINDIKTASFLAQIKPKIVIGDFSEAKEDIKSVFIKNGIIIVDIKDVERLGEIEKFNRFYGLNKEVLNKIETIGREKGFIDWLKAYKKKFL